MPSAVTDARDPVGAGAAPGATSPARCCCALGGEQPGARARPPAPASSAALPPGPAHRSSQRSSAPLDARPRQGERDQLGALVLDAGAPLGDRRHRGRVAALQHHAVRRVAGSASPGSSSRSRPPGPGDQGHPGRLRCRRPAARRARRSPTAAAQLLDDPARVAVRDGGVADRVGGGVGRHPAASRRGRARRPCAARRWRSRPAPWPTRARTRSTVVLIAAWPGTRIAEQLVGAEPQRVEDLRARPWPAAGPRRRPAPRRRCPGGAACPTPARSRTPRRARRAGAVEHGGQHQVGVGVVLADRPSTSYAASRAGSARVGGARVAPEVLPDQPPSAPARAHASVMISASSSRSSSPSRDCWTSTALKS